MLIILDYLHVSYPRRSGVLGKRDHLRLVYLNTWLQKRHVLGSWMTLDGNFIQRKVLWRSQWVSWCSLWNFLVNGNDPIPTWNMVVPKRFQSRDWNNFFPLFGTLLYVVMSNHFDCRLSNFDGFIFLPQSAHLFKVWSWKFGRNFIAYIITISWSLMLLNQTFTNHEA